MTVLSAIIQGIIQGLTEFLPISSSGHLSLYQYFTGQSGESGVLFTILLHLGTLLAVFLAFYKTILRLIFEVFLIIRDIFRRQFSIKKAGPYRRMVFLLFVSLLPMGFSFFLLDFFDKVASDSDIIVEGICFLVTSLLLFGADKCVKGRKNAKNMKYRDAVAIGAMQAVAPLPGISRSGSTIAMGLFMGLDRKFAVSFSFIMGVPTVLGANLLKLGDVAGEGMPIPIPALVAGLLTSLVFGLLAIRMVNWLVTSDKFKYFAWYTLILGLVVIVVGIIEFAAGGPVRTMVLGMMM